MTIICMSNWRTTANGEELLPSLYTLMRVPGSIYAFGGLILISIGLVSISCVFPRAASNEAQPQPVATNHPVGEPRPPGIRMGDIRLFAWWWSEADARKGIDTKNPPPRVYREIFSWE